MVLTFFKELKKMLNSHYKNTAPLFVSYPLHGPIEPILWYKHFQTKVGILFRKCSIMFASMFFKSLKCYLKLKFVEIMEIEGNKLL